MKNFVVDATIDPKVVMDLSIFKIGVRNSLQPISQNLLEKFVDKNEPWLLIGIPSRDPFLVTHSTWKDTLRVQIKHEEIDVTSRRDAMTYAIALC